MSLPWFYCAGLAAAGETVTLDADEARHALGSRRLRPGEAVVLFDGRGALAEGRIAATDPRRRGLEVRVEQRDRAPPPPEVVLASALPKGERQGVLLDMATQLGMTTFIPLTCERSVVRPSAAGAPRWWRICLEACKQSRRAYLPEIAPPARPAELAVQARARGQRVWLGHPRGAPFAECAGAPIRGPLLLMVGPEGGFTEAEVRGVQAEGGETVSLGQGVLRVETAAVALLAAVALSRRP